MTHWRGVLLLMLAMPGCTGGAPVAPLAPLHTGPSSRTALGPGHQKSALDLAWVRLPRTDHDLAVKVARRPGALLASSIYRDAALNSRDVYIPPPARRRIQHLVKSFADRAGSLNRELRRLESENAAMLAFGVGVVEPEFFDNVELSDREIRMARLQATKFVEMNQRLWARRQRDAAANGRQVRRRSPPKTEKEIFEELLLKVRIRRKFEGPGITTVGRDGKRSIVPWARLDGHCAEQRGELRKMQRAFLDDLFTELRKAGLLSSNEADVQRKRFATECDRVERRRLR